MTLRIGIGLAAAAALLAQAPTPGVRVETHERIHVGEPGAAGFSWVSAESGFEMQDVKGAPFSGDFVTETVQTLGDGNRIRSSSTSAYARDGEGRSRREMAINAIGPWAAGKELKAIFIHDPVSKIDYVLNPDEKSARKINVGAIAAKPGTLHFERKLETPGGERKEVMVFQGRAETVQDVVVAAPGAGSPSPERIALPGGAVFHTIGDGIKAAGSPAVVKTEKLGNRMIEGVEAEGTRTTVTIPAGQMGNERAMETVSERWYSNELKTVVMTTRTDPRAGETTYRLTNLRRGEPSRSSFEVPGDYKVTEDTGAIQVIRMKKETK
ncbi:MAG: hypothetical protein FJW30_19505 [Acidobacteria bacterium]|nr:hypothetical protein [Acidobacteriota bacterium]